MEAVVARLRSQASRGELVLFLGAGFSVEARDTKGRNLPTSPGLAEEFWQLAFPGEAFDPTASLGDVFQSAKIRNPRGLSAIIRERLSVSADNLEGFYATWFSLPWVRCYTLNVDDLEQAVARRFQLPRGIRAVSATSESAQGDPGSYALEVVHLNGAIWDGLDDLTFSDLDYAARLTRPDKWYVNCATDVLSRPVVFVGTRLNESMLWQYIEFRRSKGPRGTRELRPGSYLVCPTLDSARRLLLKELNVDWIPMTARAFESKVLQHLGEVLEAGHRAIRARYDAEQRRNVPYLVSELAVVPAPKTEYLLGEEPAWADLQSGRAIERDCDSKVYELAASMLSSPDPSPPLILSGTAGSGKSTSLMRLALRLSAEGIPVYWLNEESNVAPHKLLELVRQTTGPIAILIDDADLWGSTLSGWARDLPRCRAGVLLAPGLRSSKVDGLLDPDTLAGVRAREISMPPLTDDDIEALISVLDRENRLGVLKGKSHVERVEAFRQQAGRQLLVAMIQATSGKRLREKVIEEFSELSDAQRFIYAIICLVSSQRFTLDREEVLLAVGDSTNETLNALERLVQRHVIVRKDIYAGYKARHRVIADEIVSAMEFRPFVGPVVEGICFAFANRISPNEPRTSRRWRRLIRFMNHAYILKITTPDSGRAIYARIEQVLNWDYHYWLQRGSLEVEEGDLELATNFLDQARSLAPGQRAVETEYAYLLMKKAARSPRNTSAADWFDEGKGYLEDLISQHGKGDTYPYHVLGSQTLAWARQAPISVSEKRALLRRVLDAVELGAKLHPHTDELRDLANDLKTEWLMTAVSFSEG